MIYKGIDIERREPTVVLGRPHWNLCADDYGYQMYRTKRPRDHAVSLIKSVFSDEEIKTKRFVYVPRVYRGRQSQMDTIEIYYRERYNL